MARLNGSRSHSLEQRRPPSRYLDNQALLEEVERSQELGRVTPRLGQMLLLLTRKGAQHPWFRRYSYAEDLTSTALITACSAVLKFDPTRHNPYAYLRTTIHRALIRALKQEYRHYRHRDVEPGEYLVDVSATCSVSAAF